MDNSQIVGESFFENLPSNPVFLRDDFVPLSESLIWEFNRVFWKHVDLWEKTFGEHYEKTLPAGVSESHRPEFIQKSAEKFLTLLQKLERSGSLPKEIIVVEQGPGTGIYAAGFLDFFKNQSSFYKRIKYVLLDDSKGLLEETEKKLDEHCERVVTYQYENFNVLPEKYSGKVLLFRNGNVWDQFPCRVVKCQNGQWREVFVRESLPNQFDGEIVQAIKKREIEKLFLRMPGRWKDIWRLLKLTEKLADLPESFPFKEILPGAGEELEIVWNSGVIADLNAVLPLIDWQNGGHFEAVDIVLSKIEQFKRNRRPKKYDGGIAVAINGMMISDYCRSLGRTVTIEPIVEGKINSVVTIS